ncbi:hypothetical protein HH310_16970 [Actinoplanes sp. TBRC 11911]|uniref:DUF6959 family protein n=1 Tax=Actinoplanes sp. TBRC 11911 TaxID=2729386 RepID=UPI00145C4253|nr:hypothetical protein [Actinoplanes sp. TBRC 11911]NMO52877.1 hypothetical protein [Actinoplanes sp. TBRC 11911]
MEDQQARVLRRDGNAAVVQLTGRAFPGIHLQGDTFAAIQKQLAEAAVKLRRIADDHEALDDLDYAVEEMAQLLRFYEAVLTEGGMQRPY